VDVSVVEQFCSLTLAFIKKGEEAKKGLFAGAAKKLEVQPRVVEAAITALSFLLVKAAKLNLTVQEFTDSLAILTFAEDKNKLLLKTYEENKAVIRSLQEDLSFELPHFSDLRWRLDVQLATRSCRDQVNPLFVFLTVLLTGFISYFLYF